MIWTIVVFIVLAIACGDCVFLGIVLTTFLKYEPAFYGWNIAAFVVAVFWAVWFIAELVSLFTRKKPKRKKSAKTRKQKPAPVPSIPSTVFRASQSSKSKRNKKK